MHICFFFTLCIYKNLNNEVAMLLLNELCYIGLLLIGYG